MSQEQTKRVVVISSVNYPDAVQIVDDLARKEDRSLGQSAAMLIREASLLRRQGCTCGRSVPHTAVGVQSG